MTKIIIDATILHRDDHRDPTDHKYEYNSISTILVYCNILLISLNYQIGSMDRVPCLIREYMRTTCTVYSVHYCCCRNKNCSLDADCMYIVQSVTNC